MRKFTGWAVLGLAAAAFLPLLWAAEPPFGDIAPLLETPELFPAPGFEAEGVRALFYAGMPHQGKPTRVFAWYGAPDTPPGTKLPAMVLVHGGGGTAFAEWVRLWTGRGYAALAMDTCGCVPRGEYGKWERHPDGGPAGWGGFDQADQPPGDQWPYHAVSAVVLGHSLLRSFPEVDPERIGLTGISWGGYLTCITAGVDRRFVFAAPVYGCGFLGENSAWLDTFTGMGPEKTARWLELWDPPVYLKNAAMPMLWVNGTNDFAYPMDSWRKSHRLPPGEKTLCLRVRMPHGHGGAGENPEEIHVFADHLLKGGPPLPRVSAQGRDGHAVWAEWAPETPVLRAELNYTRDSGKWQDRNWETLPAELDQASRRATGTIPDGATVCYLNLFDARDRAVSAEHVEASPAETP